MGMADMLDPSRDRIVIVELDSTMPIRHLVANPRARRLVVYTWNFHPISSRARRHMVRTATCPRHCRPVNW